MPIKTRRWDDPREPDDGLRLLICRYRPRGVSKSGETWDRWEPHLGPSKSLLAAFKTSSASPLSWSGYRSRYLREMTAQRQLIDELAALVRSGQTVTLLCASACVREARCHRSLLRELIDASAGQRTKDNISGVPDSPAVAGPT